MSQVKIQGNASGTGIFTIASPNGNTDRTLTLPDQTGTVLTNAGPFTANASASAGAVTIDASNNVGIGTTSPDDITSGYTTVDVRGSTGGGLRLGVAGGNNMAIYASATTSVIEAAGSAALQLVTNSAERARIDSSGKVLIGKAASSDTTVGVELQPNGYATATASSSANTFTTWNVYSTGAGAYRFYVGAGGTVYATSTTISAISDQRLKENVQDLDVGLDAVMALKPRKFDWKEGKGKNIKGDRGWIAQEFETVFPDMIDEWRDPAPEGEEPYKSVRADLIPVLVKAIQEQQALIESLTARIAALEGAAP